MADCNSSFPSLPTSAGREAEEHGAVGQPGTEVLVGALLHAQVVERQLRAVPPGGAGEGGAREGSEGPGRAGRERETAQRAGEAAVSLRQCSV